MAFTFIEDEYGSSWACDGICFDPERVKSEIFTLEGVYSNYMKNGEEADWEDQMLALKEVSRTISIISLHSRFQITSYFQRIPSEIEPDKRKEFLESERLIATSAMGKVVGYEQENLGAHSENLRFYDAIGKICHVEKWRFPINIPENKKHLYTGLETKNLKNVLLIEITKRGKEPVTGDVQYCLIDIPSFTKAAFEFVSDCPDCMEVVYEDLEQVENNDVPSPA